MKNIGGSNVGLISLWMLGRTLSSISVSASIDTPLCMYLHYAHTHTHTHIRAHTCLCSHEFMLDNRIEYLSRAVMCAKSCNLTTSASKEGEFLHELEEKMEVSSNMKGRSLHNIFVTG